MTKQFLLGCALALLTALPVHAQEPATIGDFLEFQERLRVDLENGVYGSISAGDMDLVSTSQATLDRLLSGKTSLDELDDGERLAVFNAQEAIIAVLTDTVDERPICRRRHTVGSHRQVTECFTPRQARELASRSRDAQMRWQEIQNRSTFTPPSDG